LPLLLLLLLLLLPLPLLQLPLHFRPHVIVVRRRQIAANDIETKVWHVGVCALHCVDVAAVQGVKSASWEEHDAGVGGGGGGGGYFVEGPGGGGGNALQMRRRRREGGHANTVVGGCQQPQPDWLAVISVGNTEVG